MVSCVSSHLLDVPAAELCGDLNPLRVFVHREVEVSAALLHRQMVPMLIIQQAAEGGETPGLRGRGTWKRRGGGDSSEVARVST